MNDNIKSEPHKKQFCFEFEGELYYASEHHITLRDIRTLVGIPDSVAVVRLLDDGTYAVVQDGDRINLAKVEKFKRLPLFRRG